MPKTLPHPYTLPDLKAVRLPWRTLDVAYRPGAGRNGAYRPGEVKGFPDV